ncbi:[protein-PII] uridylyltransferase [Catenovulum sp. 2E275]|uniref:[protein-PII] uridylyltransferase n=1 Tax=Catenovulum sp. 2E275 TaxID=2980497 RepID=UPI0021D0C6DE|nr:[protein-PII] uridylyltransferase [Catenovulum sp. 2E275]MCU4675746.1 [protein-PII] uridylyltransferase [Catenovulum sp. 2E275]
MSSHQFYIEKIKNIDSLDNISALRELVDEYHEWLISSFTQQPISKLVLGRAFYVDKLIQRMWQILKLDQACQLCLCAVGGYGRGHLNLHSDIDLLILSANPIDTECQQQVSQFVTALWDLGLDIGQSVRTVKETIQLAQEDITIATNLLESRLLIGDKEVFNQLNEKISSKRFWPSVKFYKAKVEEQQARHKKFHDTSYNLEPNLKENPGCLRDIQNIGWIAKKHYKVFDGDQLVKKDFMTAEELRELQDCREFLWHMRFALHMAAGRSENRLLFEYQPEVANLLGYGDNKAAVETMMKRFFVMVRRVAELNQVLLQYFADEFVIRFRPWKRKKLSEDFEITNGLLLARHEEVFEMPAGVLNMFLTIANAKGITGIHSSTLRLLRNARRKYETLELCQLESCRKIFMELLKHPNFFGLSWQLMHKHGVMAVYSHDWAHIVGLMQFDLFHSYTVDEHTYRVVRNVFRYTQAEYKDDFPRCTSICNNFPKLELLYIAAIYHDICKGKGGDHSELGSEAVRDFCRLHEVSESNTDLVAWLVENHLLMSVVAQRKDINDPEVIADFCDRIYDETHLNLLYALTLADIRATNSTLLNEWKASLLKQLYIGTLNALRSGLEKPESNEVQEQERRQDAFELLTNSKFTSAEINQLWQTFPPEYFLRYNSEQIAWHTQSILKTATDKLVVGISNEIHPGGTAVFVFHKDQDYLFASICSSLDRKNFNIHDAIIMNTKDGYAMDTFIVLEDDGNQAAKKRFKDIQDAVKEATKSQSEPSVPNRIPRLIKPFQIPTTITWVEHKNDKRSRMELEALDTPGLLVKIGRVFFNNNITIHAAKVATIGERAEDFFVLTNKSGEPLTDDEKSTVADELRAALQINPSNKR